jgi:hypothetical protein
MGSAETQVPTAHEVEWGLQRPRYLVHRKFNGVCTDPGHRKLNRVCRDPGTSAQEVQWGLHRPRAQEVEWGLQRPRVQEVEWGLQRARYPGHRKLNRVCREPGTQGAGS